MPNGVKYSTTTPSGSLRKDNVALGVNGNLGPTANTGFYSMPAPASGKYIINKVAASGVPLFFAPQNDTELIQLARNEGATGANTGSAAAVLAWIATQPNLEAANFEYENIVTSGLVFNVDAGFVGSYPTTASAWYDLSGNNNNGTLTNGLTFNSANSGSIVFDGVDDYVDTNFSTNFSTSDFTLYSWAYPEFDSDTYGRPILTKNGNGGCGIYDFALEYGRTPNQFTLIMDGGTSNPILNTTGNFPKNNWYNAVATREYLGGTNYKCTIYINGTSNATTTGNFTGGNGSKMTIGKFIDCAPVGNWLGKIALCSIYNRALTQAEILQNYNAQKGRFGL